MKRRSLVKRTLAISVVPYALLCPGRVSLAQDNPSLVRTRLEEFVKDPARVASLRRGVAEMKKRKPSDPTSWFFQSAIHGVTADAVQNALTEDPQVATVDQDRFWNQCPHQERAGTGGADFLVWHRAYIYYFERILRAASGDSSLCLPYWNYVDPAQRLFPAIFGEEQIAGPTGPEANVLFDARRENAFAFGFYELTDAAVSPDAALAAITFFDDQTGRGIAGDPNAGAGVSQGLIERRPHNLLHFAIGGFIATTPDGNEGTAGLMGEVSTAAFDPIFWVHHSNIDRLWSSWDAIAGKSWGTSASGEWFQARPWWFYDADKTIKNETRAFYISSKKLGVSYDSDAPSAPRLSDAIPAVGDARLARAAESVRKARKSEIASESTGMTIKGVTSGSAMLLLKAKAPFAPQPGVTAPLRAPAAPNEVRRVLLTFAGISSRPGAAMAYDVFVNLPASDKADRKHPSFAGTLGLFGLEHAHTKAHHESADTLDITEVLRRLTVEPDSIEVKVIPVPLLKASSKRGERLVQPRDATLTIKKVTISALALPPE